MLHDPAAADAHDPDDERIRDVWQDLPAEDPATPTELAAVSSEAARRLAFALLDHGMTDFHDETVREAVDDAQVLLALMARHGVTVAAA